MGHGFAGFCTSWQAVASLNTADMIHQNIKSPFTGGRVHLIRRWTRAQFRRESFEICAHAYLCADTGREFSTKETDAFNLQQLYNQYRAKHQIPFPAEIKAIREQYGLSSAKIAEVLDFGTNSYRQYEQGEIPSLANAKLIRLARDPQHFRSFVAEKKACFTPKAYEKLQKRIQELTQNNNLLPLVEYIWNHHTQPNEYTGYVKPSLEKVAHYIIFFATENKPLKTRMNKLLFYGDFLNFKRTGYSISGCNYRAIQMGPVPSHFRELFGLLESQGYIRIEDEIFEHGGVGERFYPAVPFDPSLFSPEELQSMKDTVTAFADTRTKQIIALSHEESAWKANQEQREIISYLAHAFELKALE
ncbi:MAG: DUF4065 domain-containing protein [Bacteroidetes bacterium]|nr:MAG: DUF4065 domain-containing protein [Bacteroidota bacterium]